MMFVHSNAHLLKELKFVIKRSWNTKEDHTFVFMKIDMYQNQVLKITVVQWVSTKCKDSVISLNDFRFSWLDMKYTFISYFSAGLVVIAILSAKDYSFAFLVLITYLQFTWIKRKLIGQVLYVKRLNRIWKIFSFLRFYLVKWITDEGMNLWILIDRRKYST